MASTATARLSFYLASTPDTDKNRIRDWWEDEYPCVKSNPNAAGDPDVGQLNNFGEYRNKTNPCNPDTDDGGENDGPEVNGGAEPLFALDDGGIRPATFRPWPGVDSVILKLALAPTVTSYDIYRFTGLTDTNPLLAADLPPDNEYVDETLPNGQSACYRIVAKGRGGQATSRLACATPSPDPHPPHGVVAGPAGDIPVPAQIVLILEASDAPEEEEHPPMTGNFSLRTPFPPA